MGSKHSRPSQPSDGQPRPDGARPRDNQQEDDGARPRDNQQEDDGISAEARAEFTVDDIHSAENTRRAQSLRGSDFDRFCKYRNYFKNHHMSLAREVGRKTSKSKAELLRWVDDVVGPLDGGEHFTKDEILEIAMVSAALTEYSEKTLAAMYDRGELDLLPNVPLHTHNLRMPAKQQACRDSSDAANKDKLEAAHYIGLEVMLRLNERLPVEQRMGEELREILNHPSNLRLMLATSNQVLHKKVDSILINAQDASTSSESTIIKSKPPHKISAREYDRLVQIAKHAQDEGFQDAMIAANGYYLYASLRQQFNRLDVGDRSKLWDTEKDKRELRYPPRSRFRSPSPAPQRPRTPPSPEKKRDPVPRTAQNSSTTNAPDEKHRNPFSRLAAKIFRSHSKKKKKHAPATARSASTTARRPEEPSHSAKPKIPVRATKKNPVPSTNAKRPTGTTNKPNQKNKGKSRPPAGNKAARKSGHPSNQESASGSDSSADDSDYVDADPDEDDNQIDQVLQVGPRGGKYYINTAGRKVYVK